MRVKVGNEWFEVTPDAPIMVELTDQDKKNIANMHRSCSKYACFDDYDSKDEDEHYAWMNDAS